MGVVCWVEGEGRTRIDEEAGRAGVCCRSGVATAEGSDVLGNEESDRVSVDG